MSIVWVNTIHSCSILFFLFVPFKYARSQFLIPSQKPKVRKMRIMLSNIWQVVDWEKTAWSNILSLSEKDLSNIWSFLIHHWTTYAHFNPGLLLPPREFFFNTGNVEHCLPWKMYWEFLLSLPLPIRLKYSSSLAFKPVRAKCAPHISHLGTLLKYNSTESICWWKGEGRGIPFDVFRTCIYLKHAAFCGVAAWVNFQ